MRQREWRSRPFAQRTELWSLQGSTRSLASCRFLANHLRRSNLKSVFPLKKNEIYVSAKKEMRAAVALLLF